MRFTRKTKNFLIIVAAILVTVITLSVLGSLSDGFSNWDTSTWQLRDRNKENLLSGKFTDYNPGNGITAKAKDDGTIILDGEYVGSESSVVIPVEVVALSEGTYTFTGAPKGSTGTYNLQLVYDGKTVYSDFDGCTFKLESAASVTVQIVVYPKVEINNVTIRPVIVAGDEAGDFYA